jgi:DNA-binding MarR family transcriptional regulator
MFIAVRANSASDPAANTPLSPLEIAAWRGMLVIHAALIEELDDELQLEQRLPLSSYDVLVHLNEASGRQLRMSELADRVLLTKSGLTRIVDVLQRQGLVERVRSEEDARGLYARLTRKGRTKVRAAQRSHIRGVRARFTDKLSEEQLQSLAGAWRSVRPELVPEDKPC